MNLSGDLMQWHKVALDFSGPDLTEAPATFTDYRLDVVFTHTDGTSLTVPGYFAGDGDAANTSSTAGTVWRAHFNPPKAGDWTWEAAFTTGENVVITPENGTSAGFFDGTSGTFAISESDKSGVDLRGQGVLSYTGDSYLNFAGTGDTFLKSGVGSPENYLGYSGFDNTPEGQDLLPHVQDFVAGDPTWGDGAGQGIIGAVNYLASEGVNSLYFMAMNIAGDGRDVSPWSDTNVFDIERYDETDLGDRVLSFDISKLAQWEIVFEHMQKQGIVMHMFFFETENDYLLDAGETGLQASTYIRELVARFGHHNGIIWNLGEENSNTTQQVTDRSDYLRSIDAYSHPVALHTYPGRHDKIDDFAGSGVIDIFSVQTRADPLLPDPDAQPVTAANAGHPIVSFWDEPLSISGFGLIEDGQPGAEENHALLRDGLWQFYTEGGAGVSWYFAGSDNSQQDYRTRDSSYDWSKYAREFWEAFPLEISTEATELATGVAAFGRAVPGAIYAFYLPDGGTPSVDLTGVEKTLQVGWYDPLTGGDLLDGSVTQVVAGGITSLGAPPFDPDRDWAVLVWDPDLYQFGTVVAGGLTLTVEETTLSEDGGTTIATLTRLTDDLSTDLVVGLSVSDPTEATAPASVTIPADAASITFAVNAIDDPLVDGPQTVVISAIAEGFQGTSAQITVTDDDVVIVGPDPLTLEAEEAVNLEGYVIKSSNAASNGSYINLPGYLSEGRATFAFDQIGGVYDIELTYFDETDGQSTFTVVVDGVPVGSIVADDNLGSALADSETLTSAVIPGVSLSQGAIVTLVGARDGGEPARLDKLTFTYQGDTGGPDITPPALDGATAADVTADNRETTTITLDYVDNVEIDVSTVGVGDLEVVGPNGTGLEVLTVSGDEIGGNRSFSAEYTVAAPNGTFTEDDNGLYTVSLRADEVFDAAGNPVAGQIVTTFDVNVGGGNGGPGGGPTGDPIVIEAEAFEQIGGSYQIKSIGAASGGQVLQSTSTATATASTTFGGASGTYTLGLNVFDENDGESSFSLLVNEVQIGTALLDQDLGSALADPQTAREITWDDIDLETGDMISLVAQRDGKEPARFDFLELTPTGPAGPDVTPPVAAEVVTPVLQPANLGDTSFDIVVKYEDNA